MIDRIMVQAKLISTSNKIDTTFLLIIMKNVVF